MRVLCALLLVGSIGAQDEAVASPESGLRIEQELFLVSGESRSLAFSPDGSMLASGGELGEVILFDLAAGEQLRMLQASHGEISALRFSPDGRRLAVLGRDLSLWDVDENLELARREEVAERGMDWSRDGNVIACATGNRQLALLSGDDLAERRLIEVPDPTLIEAVALAPNADRVAVGKGSGKTYVLGLVSGEELERHAQAGRIRGLGYTGDGRLFRAAREGDCFLFDEEHKAVLGEPGPRGGGILSGIEVQLDGSRCACRGETDSVLLYPDGEALRLSGGGALALHPDGERWARVGPGVVEILRGREVLHSLATRHIGRPQQCAISGDGRMVVVAGGERPVGFDADSGKRLGEVGLPDGEPISNPFGPELVLRASDGLQWWLPVENGTWLMARQLSFETPVLPRAVRLTRLTAAGRMLVVEGSLLRLFGEKPEWIELGEPGCRDLVASADGERIFAAGPVTPPDDGASILSYDAEGVELLRGGADFAALGLDLRPNQRDLAVGAIDGLRLYDPATLELNRRLACALSRPRWLDDEHLVGIAPDGRFELWRVGDEVPLLRLGHPGVRAFSLSADGRRAVVRVKDRVLVVSIPR